MNELKELPILKKVVHFSWWDPTEFRGPVPSDTMKEYCRIIQCVPIHLEKASSVQLGNAVLFARQEELELCVITSRGPEQAYDLMEWSKASLDLRQLRASVQYLKSLSPHRVSFLMDWEHLIRTPENQERLRMLFEFARDQIHRYFPHVQILHYGTGLHPAEEPSGFKRFNHGVDIPRDSLVSTTLYHGPDLGLHRATLEANLVYNKPISAWVSLGAYYVPHDNKWGRKFKRDASYRTGHSYRIGRNLNHPYHRRESNRERFGPWGSVSRVVLYPCPTESPEQLAHFVQYAKGATD